MKICTKCGVSKEDILFPKSWPRVCRSCKSIHDKNYRKNDRDAEKRYREKKLLNLTPEKKEAILKKARCYQAKYRVCNPEKTKSDNAKYYAENPDASRIKNQNYRAKKRANGGKLSKGLAAKLFKLQQGKCACCRNHLDKYHLDHRMPIALGGENEDLNMQLLCPTCNLQKHAKHPIDFMQSKGFLL